MAEREKKKFDHPAHSNVEIIFPEHFQPSSIHFGMKKTQFPRWNLIKIWDLVNRKTNKQTNLRSTVWSINDVSAGNLWEPAAVVPGFFIISFFNKKSGTCREPPQRRPGGSRRVPGYSNIDGPNSSFININKTY